MPGHALGWEVSMKCILKHKANQLPTREEIKQVIIQRLLDIEYPPEGEFYEEDHETWDLERQILVMKMGWNQMSLIEFFELLK